LFSGVDYRKHAYLSYWSYSISAVREHYGVRSSINLRNGQAQRPWYDKFEDVPTQEPWIEHLQLGHGSQASGMVCSYKPVFSLGHTLTTFCRSTLSNSNKKKYIDAVLCLQSKPAKSGSIAPGAKSRYDDFIATHINQTLTIHGTGNFLSWHRYYIYAFEEALRNECGYKGYIPYANWGRYAEDLLNSPIFDGSAYSISGNGEYRNHTGASVPSAATPFIQLPAGSGGGCITTGPFKNMSVNLGPVAPVFTDVPKNPLPDGLGYNPRCLRRDIGVYAASIASTDANSTDLIRHNSYIGDFQTVMQGDFAAGLLGVHTAGHFWAGGDGGGTYARVHIPRAKNHQMVFRDARLSPIILQSAVSVIENSIAPPWGPTRSL
jgi:hypothetical protein